MSVEQLIEETTKKVTITAIQDVIRSLKNRKASNDYILDFLTDTFGTEVSTQELKDLIAKTK